MKRPISILGINGSPKRSGLCFKLLKTALAQSKKEGAKIKLIHLADYEKSFFHGRYTKVISKQAAPLFKIVKQADGIIFATPVYWFTMSALMKNFIDELTILELRGFELENKVGTFIVTCEEDGGQKTILDMMAPLNHMGFLFPPYAGLFYNKNMAKKSEHGWMDKEARLIGGNTVKLANLVKSKKKFPWDYRELKK